jgi:hypothetical protein
MRPRLKLFVLCLPLILSIPIAHATEDRLYLRLAAFHAPVVFQETGHNPKADAITRFDYDGDYVGNNNWKNLEAHATPAHVYYDVRESKTHYFIMYSFFHARDYSYFCIPWICHENDLEGSMTIIEKNEKDWQGKVVAVQTLAHDRIYTHEGIGGIRPVESDELRAPASDQGAVKKVSLFIEWGGHGVYAWDPGNKSKLKEDKNTYLNSYEQIMSIAVEDYSKDWLVYHYGGQADDPKGASSGIYSYELVPMYEELWDRRGQIGQEHVFAKTYDFKGTRFELLDVPAAFAGQKWGSGRARPPWAWMNIFSKDDNRGEWFLDPAFYASKKLKRYSKEISLEYVHNPYVN